MSKLATLILALALLGAATAATAETMSCFVDTAANDHFTPRECFGWWVPGRHFATAVFRVDNLLPNAEVLWSNSQCDSSSATCAVDYDRLCGARRR